MTARRLRPFAAVVGNWGTKLDQLSDEALRELAEECEQVGGSSSWAVCEAARMVAPMVKWERERRDWLAERKTSVHDGTADS